MKKFKNYYEIPEKYRFDLEHLLEGKTINHLINEFDKYSDFLVQNKDNQFKTIENYLKYQKKSQEFGIYLNKVDNYLYNKKSTNVVDSENNKNYAIFKNKLDQFEAKIGSTISLFFKNIDNIEKWKNDPKVSEYKKDIDDMLECEKYKLNDEIEKFIVDSKQGEVSLYETFSILYNSETKFKDIIDEKGKKYTLNSTNYKNFLLNKNSNIRKQAYENFYNGYLEHKSSFSSLLIQHIKSDSTKAKIRGYKSLVDSKLFSDRINVKLVENLYNTTKKNIYIYRKYEKLNAIFYKKKYNEPYNVWNSKLPLINVKQNYSIEEAKEILLEAIKPMGNEYYNKVKEALEQRWVDYHHVPNKRGGAYSIGQSYGVEKKLILMNYDGTFDGVSTLAHEMGHSMHSWYSDKTQPYVLSSYPIILAEIASIFNELMLLDYFFNKNNNIKLKFDLVKKSIDDFYQTVIKQTFWSNYEFELYKKIDNKEPINSYEALEEIYVNIHKDYAKDPKKIKKGKIENISSVTIPHFYYDFYVYKYAVGYIVANIFYQKYKQNGKSELENYIKKFLSAGGSKWPIEILKDAGINLEEESVIQLAFDLLNDKVKTFEKLGNQIFKIKKTK
ncbi:oligoendopeptidase F [Mesomycoplasma neurolyticum]|uniref:Oligopeptidase F n=1 Tax=Mesomycoplasma neurolyticum TaxID=2120 RepID=A0A449A4I4_9BACT|nr:oligoendopeptidase F [Mesomycoplasma neurolyticum]VEU59149.1 Oligoendopeptidase F, plasmid [Mesomycoplasma neurolyticum]